MKRFVTSFLLISLGTLLLAGPAGAAFGFNNVRLDFLNSDGSPAVVAGSHPFAVTTSLDLNTVGAPDPAAEVPDKSLKSLFVRTPAGLIGTPSPVPFCPPEQFLDVIKEGIPACPDSSVIGTSTAKVKIPNGSEPLYLQSPVYNLAAPFGVAAKLGFIAFSVPVTVEFHLNSDPPYNLISSVSNTSQAGLIYGARLTLWGSPSDPAHDPYRGNCLDTGLKTTDEINSLGQCPVDVPEVPFITLPRACEGPLTTVFEADSWQAPGIFARREATTNQLVNCDNLGFAPRITSTPTSGQAETATGLNFNLDTEDDGLADPGGVAHSDIRKAVVTLPKGITVNPSQAEGLETCSPEQFEQEAPNSAPGEGCPQASRIGGVEVESSLLEDEVLRGSIFVATPFDNPFNSLIAVYMTVKSPKFGISVRLAGRVDLDPETGQLISTFGEAPFDLPQIPFSHLRFHFRDGDRAPLVMPAHCGTYSTVARFTPWADSAETFTATSSFSVTQGVGGTSCQAGSVPFSPGFKAGTLNNAAGAFSPFYMRFNRRDGEQELTRFSATLPPGLLAKLSGVSQCPAIAAIIAREKTGRDELVNPSCPANSQIGRVIAGGGVGTSLTYVGGKLYLSGAFKGAPLSVIAVVPAVAGPFDIGTVVTQVGLQVDSRSGQARVVGTDSDAIPRILSGIPVRARDIQVIVDRPDFTLNPTNCNPFTVDGEIWGQAPVLVSHHYQAANCARLGFNPRLSLRLKGGMKRGGHPALTGTFVPGAHEANVENVMVRLPHSAFLDQGHIRTICTRVQFAADSCPPGAIYGQAAAFTPLLDEPLRGPVYLRSSDHELPDLVASLHGIVDIEAVARIDSVNGGIRARFDHVPDAPLTKVVLEMQGGRKGLIVNSRNLCLHASRARALFTGQNGKRKSSRPLIKVNCRKKRSDR